mmetsp:Transcript_108692/g.307236  ORF Transcript_108692/g.307236 Transcript_108692/m.307236 type:complete len:202 (-) Transcript_108692:79-684(-)
MIGREPSHKGCLNLLVPAVARGAEDLPGVQRSLGPRPLLQHRGASRCGRWGEGVQGRGVRLRPPPPARRGLAGRLLIERRNLRGPRRRTRRGAVVDGEEVGGGARRGLGRGVVRAPCAELRRRRVGGPAHGVAPSGPQSAGTPRGGTTPGREVAPGAPSRARADLRRRQRWRGTPRCGGAGAAGPRARTRAARRAGGRDGW